MPRIAIHRSSGNVYKDLGIPNAETMQAKATLVSGLVAILKKRKWTQEKAAIILEIPQSKVSLLCRGQFSGFSLEKIINLLNKLNKNIEIRVQSGSYSPKGHIGHTSVRYC